MFLTLRSSKRLTGAVAATLAAVGVATPAPADVTSDLTTAAESRSALVDAAPQVLRDSVPAAVTPDSTTALRATSDDGSVRVADNPAKGLTLDPNDGAAIKVGLPSATTAGDAVRVSSGAVAYDNGKSNTVVVANSEGATVLATMNGPEAPERYAYPLKLAEGQTIAATDDGGFLVFEPDGKTVALRVDAPWAKDATGRQIPVRYELEGTTVTMIVDHRGETYQYPAVADPRFSWSWSGVTMYLNRGETKNAIAWGSWALGFLPQGRAAQAISLAVGAPVTQAAANRVVDRGWCLAIYRPVWGGLRPYAYRC